MSKDTNTPEVRFKGFIDDWTETSINIEMTVNSGRDYKHLSKGAIPVYGTGGYMLSVSEALSYQKDAIGIGRKGTIDRPYILRAPFWTVDTLFFVIPEKKNNLEFLYCVFQKTEWKKKDESTGVPSLSKVAINSVNFNTTNVNEQEKIGTYFQNIDNLITQTTRKIEKLKKLKKAYLEKMFPKKGASVPEIRFKGFNGEWEENRLGECLLVQRGGSPRPIEKYITTDSDGLNWIKIGDVSIGSRYITSTKERIKQSGESKTRKVLVGDLILSNSMSFGRPYIMKIEGCIHDGWLLIRDDKKMFETEFLLQMLSTDYMVSQYKSLASGGVVNNLNSELVQSTYIAYPPLIEQKIIGVFFQNIDNQISKQEQKLTKLKNIKKACLDKMFV